MVFLSEPPSFSQFRTWQPSDNPTTTTTTTTTLPPLPRPSFVLFVFALANGCWKHTTTASLRHRETPYKFWDPPVAWSSFGTRPPVWDLTPPAPPFPLSHTLLSCCHLLMLLKMHAVTLTKLLHLIYGTTSSSSMLPDLHPQRPYGLLGTGAQDGHLDFHTVPELSPAQGPYGLLGTASPGTPPRFSHSFWALAQRVTKLLYKKAETHRAVSEVRSCVKVEVAGLGPMSL